MGLRDRLTERLLSRQLDVALANGAPADSDGALALRAQRLTDVSRRLTIARSLRRLVREARDGRAPALTRVAPCWGRVEVATDELSMLASRLTQPGPVAARGVAQALLLLTDGTGPLYNPRSEDSVRDRAAVAADQLLLA
jgi:hypothetical protein